MRGRLLADVLRVRSTLLAPQTFTSEPARAWQDPRLPVGSKVVAEGLMEPYFCHASEGANDILRQNFTLGKIN